MKRNILKIFIIYFIFSILTGFSFSNKKNDEKIEYKKIDFSSFKWNEENQSYENAKGNWIGIEPPTRVYGKISIKVEKGSNFNERLLDCSSSINISTGGSVFNYYYAGFPDDYFNTFHEIKAIDEYGFKKSIFTGIGINCNFNNHADELFDDLGNIEKGTVTTEQYYFICKNLSITNDTIIANIFDNNDNDILKITIKDLEYDIKKGTGKISDVKIDTNFSKQTELAWQNIGYTIFDNDVNNRYNFYIDYDLVICDEYKDKIYPYTFTLGTIVQDMHIYSYQYINKKQEKSNSHDDFDVWTIGINKREWDVLGKYNVPEDLTLKFDNSKNRLEVYGSDESLRGYFDIKTFKVYIYDQPEIINEDSYNVYLSSMKYNMIQVQIKEAKFIEDNKKQRDEMIHDDDLWAKYYEIRNINKANYIMVAQNVKVFKIFDAICYSISVPQLVDKRFEKVNKVIVDEVKKLQLEYLESMTSFRPPDKGLPRFNFFRQWRHSYYSFHDANLFYKFYDIENNTVSFTVLDESKKLLPIFYTFVIDVDTLEVNRTKSGSYKTNYTRLEPLIDK